MKRIIIYIVYIFSLLWISSLNSVCFGDNITTKTNTITPYNEYISDINLPWIVEYNYDWWDELLQIAKNVLNRALEYLPMLILILLLFACLKIIFDWDWKEWFKRIKYILIWVAVMILSIYVMNIVSTIFTWYPVLNIHINRFF